METGRQACRGRERIGRREDALASLEVFLADPLNICRVPVDLAQAVVRVAVKRRDGALELKRRCLSGD